MQTIGPYYLVPYLPEIHYFGLADSINSRYVSFPLGNSKTGSVDTRDIAAMAALFDYKDSENS